MNWFTEIVSYIADPWGELDPVMVERQNALSVFHKFIRDTYPVVRKFDFKSIPEVSEKFAVILEPRQDPLLEYVLRNVMHFLGDGWGLQIYVGNQNEEFVRNLTRDWEFVHIVNIGVDNLSREEFRKLRKSSGFWASMKGEALFCFETDSILCRSGVEDFLEFDYIGAPWSEDMAISPSVRVGNGGLSIRKRSVMIDICNSCKSDVIPSEDSYFSYNLHLRKNEFKLPTVEVANRFSVETMHHPAPIGIHKPWLYISEKKMQEIINSISYPVVDK